MKTNSLITIPQCLPKFCLPIAVLALGLSTADAALLTGSYTTGTVTSADLTTLGGDDWVIWEVPADNWTNPIAIYNEKLAGTSISDLTGTTNGSGEVRTSFPPAHTYSYSDGTSPFSENPTPANLGVGIRGTLADLAGDSFDLSITSTSLGEHTFTLFGAQTRTGTTLTLSLPGASNQVSTLASSGTGTINWVYTATFTPDTIGDVLTVNLASSGVSTDGANSFNSFRLGAAAISAVPEPSTTSALVIAGILALVMVRRRRGRC